VTDIRLVEIEPGKWRVDRREIPVARSSLPCPMVISDAMPPAEQVDGKFYESKAAFRAVGRALGLTEVGTSRFEPKRRSTSLPEVKKKRRNALKKAIAEYKQGRRPMR
jgi:hypothetical protein